MNRKKVNGSNVNDLSFIKKDNDCNSNSTDDFDMNDFKSSSLNQKYSVHIHKNKADLMAELNNINIMGDESDVEIVEPQAQQNRLSGGGASASDLNSSKVTSESSRSTDVQSNGDFESEKQDRILAWAQSQSQSLSMCVASILSDHDYLSQQSLVGLVTGNEENCEPENQSQNEMNGNATANEFNKNNGNLVEPNENVESVKQTSDTANVHADIDSEATSNINDLSAILKEIKECKEKEQRLRLLDEIEKKTKSLKEKFTSNKNDTAENNTPGNSLNPSEPMEYYGDVRFTSDTSEMNKESEDNEMMEIETDLNMVDDMKNRISLDAQSIRSKLVTIKNVPEAERERAVQKIRENFGLLMDDISKELKKIAVKFNPSLAPSKAEVATQKTPEQRLKSHAQSDSTDEGSNSEAYKKSRRFKRRKHVAKNHSDISDSMHVSSDSDLSSEMEPLGIIKDEPYVISQNLDDLMNRTGSNSANESIRKENDFHGFDSADDMDMDIDIKTEKMLNNSEPMVSNHSKNEKQSNKNAVNTTNESQEDDESTEIIKYDKVTEKSKDSAINDDNISSSASISEQDDDTDNDNDDDEDIRKLLDFTSIESKRIPSTHAAAKVNGIVVPKKPVKKTPKEDELSKILAAPIDSEKTVGSEEEKADQEEYNEEQFLREENERVLNEMLQNSSKDSDQRQNGKGSDYNSDSEMASDSGESLVERFLACESRSSSQATPLAKSEEKPKELKKVSSQTLPLEPKTKEQPSKRSVDEKVEHIEDDETDSDLEFGSEPDSRVPQ